MSAKPDQLSGKRLDSWKEIAAFFGRAERTVKRWETERGLPVHRVPGSARGSVFAYSDELADWLKGRGQELDVEDTASGEVEEAKTDLISTSGMQPTAVPMGTPATVPIVTGSWPASRLIAWLVPLVLAGALVIFFTSAHRETRVKALAGPHPNTESLDFPDSIAVLPFSNARGDASSDYLSDGITESLIGNLARVPQLKVKSRDSVFRYKGKDIDLPTVGGNLGVSVVVSGRVNLQGNAIEISAELTDLRDNTEIWGQHYSGKRSDVIQLQQKIAGDIAEKLHATLTRSEKQQVTRQGTQNPDAYELYLKGRYAWNKRTHADLDAAISYFNQALALDNNYALAYAGIADAYSVLHFFGANPSETFPKSNAAARKALELDPTLARPHAVLGNNEMEYDWDFSGGESEFKRAIELDPSDATSHQWYGEKLNLLGRHKEAIAEINRAHELDPLSPVIARVLGGTLADAGQYDQGIAVCKKLTEDNPTFAIAHDCLFYIYWYKHMYPQAVEEWSSYGRLSGSAVFMENAGALEHGFRAGGWPRGLAEVIAVQENRRKNGGYVSAFEIARFYADRGDKEKAFEWLDTAYRDHDSLLIGLTIYPQFNSIRSDPRFAELVAKVGLPK
jgi:TolB-like protein/Tfp pilus assembly protein PilF